MPLVTVEGLPFQLVESGKPRFGDFGEDGGAAGGVYPVAAIDLGFLASQPFSASIFLRKVLEICRQSGE
jgi:hypothetical protein